MKNFEEIEQQLKDYPETQTLDFALTEKAVARAEELYGEKARAKKRRNKRIKIGAVAATCAACVTLAIVLPVCLSDNSFENQIFMDTDLKFEQITDTQQYLANIPHFEVADTQNVLYSVIKNNKPAYIRQKFNFPTDSQTDVVVCNICLLPNQFATFKFYENLPQTIEYGNITVQYSSTLESDRYTVLSNFKINGTRYYMNITSSEQDGNITTYLDQLL